jgi:hypothetical protein
VQILRGLIERVVIPPAGDEMEIEITGKIARMVELGNEGRTSKQAALDERTACSVKVVAGARSKRSLPLGDGQKSLGIQAMVAGGGTKHPLSSPSSELSDIQAMVARNANQRRLLHTARDIMAPTP